MIKIIKHMKWWTYNQRKKNKDTAVCPKCGLRSNMKIGETWDNKTLILIT